MSLEEIMQAVTADALRRAHDKPGMATLLAELGAHLESEGAPPAWQLGFPAAEGYGVSRGDAGVAASELVREVQGIARVLVEELTTRGAAHEVTERLRDLADEAVSRAVSGWEDQRRERREMWLSHLVHDLKNPLNTVMNAVWLVRGHAIEQEENDRLLGMIERAAHRIEVGLGDVRALEQKTLSEVPVALRKLGKIPPSSM
jgi:signal transduction histidine kinase